MVKKKSSKSAPVPIRYEQKPDDWDDQFRDFYEFCRSTDLTLMFGIDPGAKGAIVATTRNFRNVAVLDTPRLDYNGKNRTKSGAISKRTAVWFPRWHYAIEEVLRLRQEYMDHWVYEDMLGYSPGLTRGATMSLLGQQHGYTESLLFWAKQRDDITVSYVKPLVWKKMFGLQQKSKNRKQSLTATARCVDDLTGSTFPEQFSSKEIHSGRCDAFLIAAWQWKELYAEPPVKKTAKRKATTRRKVGTAG